MFLWNTGAVAKGGRPASKNPFLIATLALLPLASHAGDLEGRVVTSDGQAVSNASVTLEGLEQSTRTDNRGHFHLEDIPAGRYLVRIRSENSQTSEYAVVRESGVTDIDILFDAVLDDIIVRSSPFAGIGKLDLAQPVELISGDDLNALKEASIGETLSNQLGVSSTYGGPAAGRPVIRGLSGNRVRVQQDGIGSMDVSALSPDHAVSIEPLLIDAVEIVKGPATLLYGNGAFGGVVNLEDSRIPDEQALSAYEGSFELRTDTAASEQTAVLRIDGGAGKLAWHADAFTRTTDDVEIPAASESLALRTLEALEEGTAIESGEGDHLENSDIDAEGGAFGLSWVDGEDHFGASISTYRSNYGVPGHAHEEEPLAAAGEAEEEEGVRIDLEQTRMDVKGRFLEPWRGIESLKLRVGRNDYTHREIEDGAVGTVFENDAVDARLELVHLPINGWRGAYGLQLTQRDFAATGAEAYVPPTEADTLGIFLVEEKEIGPGRFEIGARLETQDQKPQTGPEQDDTARSLSAGYVWRTAEQWNLGINLTQAERIPDIEERYSNGPHLATLQYEIGNPDLGKETANNIDLTLRKHQGRVTWTLNLFRNSVDDFIYLARTGTELDGLPVAVYTQADATLEGFETELETSLWEKAGSELSLRVFADETTGQLDAGGMLPRIPPRRFGAGLDFKSTAWAAGLKATQHDEQDDTAMLELPTEAYLMVDASVSYRLLGRHLDWEVFLRASNLLDEEARRHASFLKDLAPLPGRNFTLGLRGAF
ncbi:MAG: TonB-dependent receptor [Gammaproteobacteria bacterium]|nr:TonB-dependent receptor [Gammaproteobacteria bacterium]